MPSLYFYIKVQSPCIKLSSSPHTWKQTPIKKSMGFILLEVGFKLKDFKNLWNFHIFTVWIVIAICLTSQLHTRGMESRISWFIYPKYFYKSKLCLTEFSTEMYKWKISSLFTLFSIAQSHQFHNFHTSGPLEKMSLKLAHFQNLALI